MQPGRLALHLIVVLASIGFVQAQEAVDKRPAWFIFLESGRKTPDDRAAVQKMQTGHIENFKRLFGEKKLFAAGPLSDPSKKKRGIVVVKAHTREELLSYFQPDDYVREGYMTANAVPCTVRKALHTEAIDPNSIEEVRIIQITRPAGTLTARQQQENSEFLKARVDKGEAGAWYTLETGGIAEVLFCRTTNTTSLETIFAQYPAAKASNATVHIWPQWLSKGVVK